MFEDDNSVFAAMRAGARGYVLKGADQEEMLRTIRAVARGEALFGPAIARRLMGYFSAPRPAAEPLLFPELTEREREVLGADRSGSQQRGNRPPAGAQPEDRAQSRQQYFQQAAGCRSGAGNRAGAEAGMG